MCAVIQILGSLSSVAIPQCQWTNQLLRANRKGRINSQSTNGNNNSRPVLSTPRIQRGWQLLPLCKRCKCVHERVFLPPFSLFPVAVILSHSLNNRDYCRESVTTITCEELKQFVTDMARDIPVVSILTVAFNSYNDL